MIEIDDVTGDKAQDIRINKSHQIIFSTKQITQPFSQCFKFIQIPTFRLRVPENTLFIKYCIEIYSQGMMMRQELILNKKANTLVLRDQIAFPFGEFVILKLVGTSYYCNYPV